MRKKKLLGWAAGAALIAAGASLALREAPAPDAPQATPAPRASAANAEPQASSLALPAREGLTRPRGNPFGSNAPPERPVPPPKPVVEAPPPKPVAPPMPYRVAGQVVHDGPAQVVLARDERVYLVREGDTLDGGYRVESVRPDGVTLVYLPLEERQYLAAAATLEVQPPAPAAPAEGARAPDTAAPAQLRWEGPSSVQAGSEFDVALKITSKQPVRGSPLQLSYDAKLLEPVSVRAGGFFVDGSFTYRVNPAGSIFVGAFGKGEVPADAEFLVVTFKPIRPGAIAELKLSSMLLQGPGGGAVGHAPLAAFRTSITQ